MPQQQQGPHPLVLLFIICFIYFTQSPDQNGPPGFISPRDYAADRVARSRHALDILNTTKWQEFSPKSAQPSPGESTRYLNLTGFKREDNYAWDRLDSFKKRSAEFGAEAKKGWTTGKDGKVGLVGAVYENVTGVVVGKWVRHNGTLEAKERQRKMNLTEISPNIDWAFTHQAKWTRNITGTEGNFMLQVNEVEEAVRLEADLPDLGPMDLTRSVDATMTIQDETSSGDGWEMKVHGVHWPRQGIMYMTTTSDKFAGIFGLPHLTNDEGHFVTSQKRLNRTLEKTVEKMERELWRDLANPWSATPDTQGDATMPSPHCEFVVFVQVQPIKLDHSRDQYFGSLDILEEIERELRSPNGAPIPEAPKLEMSTVIFSPDCGFMLESKGPPRYSPKIAQHLVGKKQEFWYHQIHTKLNAFAVIIFAQILLLKIQSKEASTPSTIGRVSLYTVALMLLADALIFSFMSFISAFATNLFPSALLASFAALLSVGLGVRFVAAVYNVQEPERLIQLRAEQATRNAGATQAVPSPTPAVVITAAGVDTNVQSANSITRTPTPTPIIIPSDQDIDAEIAEAVNNTAPILPTTTNRPAATPAEPASSSFGVLYARFMFTLMVIFFLSFSAHEWSVTWRTGYTNLIAFIYLSLWIPQIHRNVVRNCRKALLWKFIIGQSVLRLLPVGYFYLEKDNIIFAQTDWRAFVVLGGWVWVQIWILIAQEVLGPRWGLPKSWYEAGWDYHPILHEDNVEAGGLPIGLVQPPTSPIMERASTGGEEEFMIRKKKDSSMRVVDCAICMQILEVPVIASGVESAAGVTGMLARRQYMVTPCRHVFHSACLEGWMRFRLQCPICRENLPPL